MATKKTEKSKKASVKRIKKATSTPSLEGVTIALTLTQALDIPHGEESYQLTVRHEEFDPWSHKLQNMHVTLWKQYYIRS